MGQQPPGQEYWLRGQTQHASDSSSSSSQGYVLGKLFSLSRPLFLMSKMSMSIAYLSQQSELTRTSKSLINGPYSFLYFIPKS